MMKEMVPPPLPPKSRSSGSNSCSTAAATVFIHPAASQVHSTASSGLSINTDPTGHVVKIKINPDNIQKPPESTSVVRISIGDPQEMLQPRANAYFFCSGIGSVPSGQCSPSDTLDSGTCSDLDGTPPPLPKKKGVTVTVIGAQHKRASSLTSSGADADSASGSGSDNESNISCDSLNSADLNHDIPSSPIKKESLPANGNTSAFLPQGLLKDIRSRSIKLSQPVEIPEEEPISRKESIPSPARSPILVQESTYEERQRAIEKELEERRAAAVKACDDSRVYTYESDKYYKFHLNEHLPDKDDAKPQVLINEDDDETFAGFKDFLGSDKSSTIRSAKGTVRGVKNRVRAGINTFLQINQSNKSYREKDGGKVVVYTTTMGIVRHTHQQCGKVKQILRTHLVKFEERDVFMSNECQGEIRERMKCDQILVPQVFVDGIHVGVKDLAMTCLNDKQKKLSAKKMIMADGSDSTEILSLEDIIKDAETIERLNESGELRRILKPYKSADACTTCIACGGYRLLPCSVCNGSKKSVHRNHFTTEFVALKCMNCDEVGLVRCSICS